MLERMGVFVIWEFSYGGGDGDPFSRSRRDSYIGGSIAIGSVF